MGLGPNRATADQSGLPDAWKDIGQKNPQNFQMTTGGSPTSPFVNNFSTLTPNAGINPLVNPATSTYLQTQGRYGQDFANAMTARNYPGSSMVPPKPAGAIPPAPGAQPAAATPSASSLTPPISTGAAPSAPNSSGYVDYMPYSGESSSPMGQNYATTKPTSSTGGNYPTPSGPLGSNSGMMNYPGGQNARTQSATFFGNNPSMTDPYQANQNMASQVASFGAQSLPGAAAFQQGLFAPGFNAAENAYLNSEGERQTRMLNSQMSSLGNKFSGTPFHSGYLNMSRELGAEAASNLGQSAQQLALNRQGLAGQAAQRILGSPMDATEKAQNVVPSMLQLISGLQTAPLQAGLSYLNGSPVMSPTILPGAQSAGGGRKK